ncbi:MAG TPA: carbohydrate ABC transporter permease [Chloroflexota bacterium]|jgi:multiple sugar transport system permease protein|nr:carbohydrate ABC transporter permease [Chloroflexota bacterium]
MAVVQKGVVLLLLALFSLPYVTPLLWMLSTALKEPAQVYVYPPQWIPSPARVENFVEGWTVAPFTRFFFNTLITTLVPLVGEVFVSAMVAYSFARVRWPGRDKVFSLCLATMLMPWVATFIPIFLEFRLLGWVDTFLPLVVPAFFGTPFYIFMLRQFMLTLPRELEEAARVDGAATFQIFVRIILPLLGPALATVAIFSFMHHWNDFLPPMIYLHKPELKTLTLGLANFESMLTGTGGSYGLLSSRLNLLMAVSFLIDVPCIVVFLLFQKYFVRDVVMSGLKF